MPASWHKSINSPKDAENKIGPSQNSRDANSVKKHASELWKNLMKFLRPSLPFFLVGSAIWFQRESLSLMFSSLLHPSTEMVADLEEHYVLEKEKQDIAQQPSIRPTGSIKNTFKSSAFERSSKSPEIILKKEPPLSASSTNRRPSTFDKVDVKSMDEVQQLSIWDQIAMHLVVWRRKWGF